MILAVRDLVTGYGLGAVIHGVSIDVDAAEVVCLLGRNGAGKSTTLRSIMGLTPPRSGRVEFMGKDITGRPAVRDRPARHRLHAGRPAHLRRT